MEREKIEGEGAKPQSQIQIRSIMNKHKHPSVSRSYVSYARSAAFQGSSDGRRVYLGFVTGDYPQNDERRKILDERAIDRNGRPTGRTGVLYIDVQH